MTLVGSSPTATIPSLDVLVAEDDPDDLYLLRDMLKRDLHKRYRVVHCSTLKETVTELRNQSFDVVLLDLGLAESQGIDTLTAVLKVTTQVPVIVLTGANNEQLGEQAIKAGAEDYLPKSEANSSLLSRAVTYAIERHRLLLQLQQQATTDALTGLPNRSAIYDHLDTLVENNNRRAASLAVALLDLDGFKSVNDQLGHRAGDDLLRQVAARLRKQLRKSDFAGRLGGDEFVVILNHYRSTDELIGVLEKKRAELVRPLSLYSNQKVHKPDIGVSIGVVEWHRGMDVQKLLAMADRAMYQSKSEGKNRITLVSPGSAAIRSGQP